MQSQEKTFEYPNAIVTVHIPDLAEDERQRRMKEIKRSAEKILKGVIKNEYSTLHTNNN